MLAFLALLYPNSTIGKKAYLVILLLVYKSFKVYFHYTIPLFGLAIGLKIEYCKKFLFDS